LLLLCACQNPCKEGHTWKWFSDAEGHWQQCTVCDETLENKTSHTITEWRSRYKKHQLICKICNFVLEEAEHEAGAWIDAENGKHEQRCKMCNVIVLEQRHQYSDWMPLGAYHEQYCTVCKVAVKRETHGELSDWNRDEKNHWKQCLECKGVVMFFAHDWVWKSDDKTHWQECETCGNKQGESSHRNVWLSDNNGHWKRCLECDKIWELQPHQVEWTGNSTNHMKRCTVCSYIVLEEAHTFTLQGFDGKNHYRYCSECEQIWPFAHAWENGICTECGCEPSLSLDRFPKGSITAGDTVIETEHFIFNIPAGVYVIDGLEQHAETVYDAILTCSGLEFKVPEEVDRILQVNGKKITVNVKVSQKTFSNSNVSENWDVYNIAQKSISIADYSLLLGNDEKFISALSILLYQKWCSSGGGLNSFIPIYGFIGYLQHQVTDYLRNAFPDTSRCFMYDIALFSFYLGSGGKPDHNWIQNVNLLKEKGIEWAIEDSWLFRKDGTSNSNVDPARDFFIGTMLMQYLGEVYGDAFKWVKQHKFFPSMTPEKLADFADFKEILRNNYGENVLAEFVPWMMRNEERLFKLYEMNRPWIVELSAEDTVSAYPNIYLYSQGMTAFLGVFNEQSYFRYDGAYINLRGTREFLEKFWQANTQDMVLTFDNEVTLSLFDEQGNFVRRETGTEFTLEGVAVARLNGKGTFRMMEIKGYTFAEN